MLLNLQIRSCVHSHDLIITIILCIAKKTVFIATSAEEICVALVLTFYLFSTSLISKLKFILNPLRVLYNHQCFTYVVISTRKCRKRCHRSFSNSF